ITARGYDLTLNEDEMATLLAFRTAQTALDEEVALNGRISTLLGERQEELIGQLAAQTLTPALQTEWIRFRNAHAAFRQRLATTSRRVEWMCRDHYKFVSRVLVGVEKGMF